MNFYKKICMRKDAANVWYIWGILFLLCLLGLYGVVYYIDHSLPTPLKIEDEESYPDSFIGERAKNYLKPLTDMGPRVTGSYVNEKCAVDYLVDTVNDIKKEANLVQKIELDVQSATGSFLLNGNIHAYANVRNIIVKISSCNDNARSILVNAHFDSAPFSPGGSDNGINVAVALEVLRKLSQMKYRPENDIIFLFNGAEEAGLLGSHGFITQHEWSEDVVVFVNLDAAGAGGKEMLFQVGPDQSWLFKYYNVPHPHANVITEEIFQNDMVPSDTDFRIFDNFGGIVGYDMAYTRDGYRYHTKFDGFENIDDGRFQHTGDNVLHLVKKLAQAPEVSDPEKDQGSMVFFDFLGLFFVYYNANSTALAINIITIILSIAAMIFTSEKYRIELMSSLLHLPFTTFVKLLGIIINCAIVLIIAAILDAASSTMSWYGTPGIVFGLYIAPTVLIQLLTTMIIQNFLKHEDLKLTKKVLLELHANRFLWSIVLLGGTIINVRSIYVITIPVLFNTAGMFTIQCLRLHNNGWMWFPVYMLYSILPTMQLMYYAHELLASFIPIMGRSGPNVNPEFIVGLMLVVITAKIVSYFVPFLLFIRERCYILILLLVVFLGGFILALTPGGFPYRISKSHPTPQRYSIYHTQRTFRNNSGDVIKSDAGFYFRQSDRSGPSAIANNVRGLERAIELSSKDCEMGIACGLPQLNRGRLQNAVWIPAAPPVFPTNISYLCTQTGQNQTQAKFDCIISGSDRIDVYLSIRPGWQLISINLVDNITTEAFTWKGQPTYYISFVCGEAASLEFTFVLEKTEYQTSPAVDLAISAKYIHEDVIRKTDEYAAFLDEFPNWVAFEYQALAQYQSLTIN